MWQLPAGWGASVSHSAACGGGEGKAAPGERRWERKPERRTKRERREAEAGIYHVAVCSPSLPGTQPRNALPKSYFLICDALSDFRASPLLPSFSVYAWRNLWAFWRLHYHLSVLEAGVGAAHRIYAVKEVCLVAVWKAALGFLQQFYRLFIWEWETKGRAVILASEEKVEKDVEEHIIIHKIVGEEDIACLLLIERKVGMASEPLVYHPWICLCRSETSARDRTLGTFERILNMQKQKASYWSRLHGTKW